MSASRRLLKAVFHGNTTELIRVPLARVQTEAWVSFPVLLYAEVSSNREAQKVLPLFRALPGRQTGRGEECGERKTGSAFAFKVLNLEGNSKEFSRNR